MTRTTLPELLAPAGDMSCFLASMAAGADAAYLGLKNFSARAGAENFSTTELARMVDLANQNGRRIYVAFNSLIKSGDLLSAGRLIKRLQRDAQPHGLIIQDIGLIDVARQAGFEGELHLSTLANISSARDLKTVQDLGVQRVVLPRELSIDEIRKMDEEAPDDMDFEMFVHGALCWCVSGRCYWSSYLGGKSGLRGRCVQPCRRIYKQKGREGRFFSCQDLSLDVLVKTLCDIPHIRSLKVEGRKKGPHYVYHVIAAYRMLLDTLGTDDWAHAKKDAESLLEMALGRGGGTFRPLGEESRVRACRKTHAPGQALPTLPAVEEQARLPQPGRRRLVHDEARAAEEGEPRRLLRHEHHPRRLQHTPRACAYVAPRAQVEEAGSEPRLLRRGAPRSRGGDDAGGA